MRLYFNTLFIIMNIRKFFVPAVAALVLVGCSSKSADNTETTDASESVPAATATSATEGKVIELEDAATLTPGVKVDRLTVVDFNAVWCGPCRQLAPVLEEMAAKYADKVDFYSVDVDKFGDLFMAYQVGESIPAVVFIQPDGTTSNYIGTGDLLPAEKFEALIDSKLK